MMEDKALYVACDHRGLSARIGQFDIPGIVYVHIDNIEGTLRRTILRRRTIPLNSDIRALLSEQKIGLAEIP